MLAMEPTAPSTAKIVEVICIASFGIVSRKGSTHASIPLLRDAGNRLLPYTVCKRDADGGTSQGLLYRKPGKCQI